MLGSGTSITNEAVRLAADNSIIIMFVNSLYKISASTDDSFNMIKPSSEYKINEYSHKIAQIFFSEAERLSKAKEILLKRVLLTEEYYSIFLKQKLITQQIIDGFQISKNKFIENINKSESVQKLLVFEAVYTKEIFKIFAVNSSINFKREHQFMKKRTNQNDDINNYLTLSNYLLYGISASALTILNIPFSFAFLHGKTRRGALVFDIADLFKDGISIPLAFYFSTKEYNESEFRKFILEHMNDLNV